MIVILFPLRCLLMLRGVSSSKKTTRLHVCVHTRRQYVAHARTVVYFYAAHHKHQEMLAFSACRVGGTQNSTLCGKSTVAARLVFLIHGADHLPTPSPSSQSVRGYPSSADPATTCNPLCHSQILCVYPATKQCSLRDAKRAKSLPFLPWKVSHVRNQKTVAAST